MMALQLWLNAHGAALVPDGQFGPISKAALLAVFTNPCAPSITAEDLTTFARRLGCSEKQLRAVAKVESGGAAYDANARPKMLFERHLFHRATDGRYSVQPCSNPVGGGYAESSWVKLGEAAALDPLAAFASASWGKFQVLGKHWQALGYPSALDLAYSTVTGEAAHYELLCRYIEGNHLTAALQSLSPDPASNVAFASAYNGPGFRDFNYHTKLASAMS